MSSVDQLKLVSAILHDDGRDAAVADVEWAIERIAELEAFAAWVMRHAMEQARMDREAGRDDMAWCKAFDRAAALTKST